MSETENKMNEMCGQRLEKKDDRDWFILLFLLFMSGNQMPDFRINGIEKNLAELKGRFDTIEKMLLRKSSN